MLYQVSSTLFIFVPSSRRMIVLVAAFLLFIAKGFYAEREESNHTHKLLSLGNTPGVSLQYLLLDPARRPGTQEACDGSLANNVSRADYTRDDELTNTYDKTESDAVADEIFSSTVPSPISPVLFLNFTLNGMDVPPHLEADVEECIRYYWTSNGFDLADGSSNKRRMKSHEDDAERCRRKMTVDKTTPGNFELYDLFDGSFKHVESNVLLPCWWLSVNQSSYSRLRQSDTMNVTLALIDGVWFSDEIHPHITDERQHRWMIQDFHARNREAMFGTYRNYTTLDIFGTSLRNYTCHNTLVYKNSVQYADSVNDSTSPDNPTQPIENIPQSKESKETCNTFVPEFFGGKGTKPYHYIDGDKMNRYRTQWIKQLNNKGTFWKNIANFVLTRNTKQPFQSLAFYDVGVRSCFEGRNTGDEPHGKNGTKQPLPAFINLDVSPLVHLWLEKYTEWNRRRASLILVAFLPISGGFLNTDHCTNDTSTPENCCNVSEKKADLDLEPGPSLHTASTSAPSHTLTEYSGTGHVAPVLLIKYKMEDSCKFNRNGAADGECDPTSDLTDCYCIFSPRCTSECSQSGQGSR